MEKIFNLAQNIVYITDLSNQIDFEIINDEFQKLEFVENIENTISAKKDFFDCPQLFKFKSIIEAECKEYINKSYGIQDQYDDLKITKSWANITYGGQSHHEHHHPFSVVSGVIFLDNSQENLHLSLKVLAPEIPYFISDWVDSTKLRDILIHYGLDPTESNHLKNHLVIFLSSCVHRVDKTPIDSKPRRTISFNTFWVGTVGKEHELASINFK